MPGGKAYKRPVSKAQARLFGAAAAGKVPGFSPEDAKKKLEGVKQSSLPARKASPTKRKR